MTVARARAVREGDFMCGRFVQIKQRRDYERYMKALAARDTKLVDERSSWNIPPSSPSWVIREIEGALRVDRLMWGLAAPSGASDRSLVSNARLESAAERNLFREAWQSRRCLVPVEGWYEWQALGEGRKQPYFFFPRSGEPVLLAGLWTGHTFVLLTAATHGGLAAVHTRRPVALSRDEARRWCDPLAAWTTGEVESVMVAEDAFEVVPVSDAVNSTRQDGPALIKALDPASVRSADLLLPGF
jgi:putative SOS response-associated peptidase YedK